MSEPLQNIADSDSADLIEAVRPRAPAQLAEFVRASIDTAPAVEEPFFHLEFHGVFPDPIYRAMLANMPDPSDYRSMSGRVKTRGANPTRVKIDLFPEYLRHLRAEKRRVWEVVGGALCSRAVQESLVRRFAPGLSRRFGQE